MLLTNLKVYLKFLGRNRVYTAVTVAGFGVSLMFVVVLGLYVRQELGTDKFHADRDRIYMAVVDDGNDGWRSAFGNPVGPWLAQTYPDVEGYVRVMSHEGDVDVPGGEPLRAKALVADSTFFTTFTFALEEGDPHSVLARRKSAVVTREFAGRVFGEGVDPVGQPLKWAKVDLTVTGVMERLPRNTIFPEVDFVADYSTLNDLWGHDVIGTHDNSSWPLFVVERAGGDVRSHRAGMVENLKTLSWIFERGFSKDIDFVPLDDVYFGGIGTFMLDMRQNSLTGVMLYLGIALLILVVALLNYVNMTVAQAGFRGREVALRKLHGASRGMIIRQLLTESLAMTIISFGVGLVLAFALEPFFDGVLGTRLALDEAFTLPVVAAIAGLMVVLAAVSGVVPAVVMSRFRPIEIVRGTFSRRVKGVYSRVLAVFQYTVSIALLICSAVIVSQSHYLSTRDVGLDRDGVMMIAAGDIEGMDRPKMVAAKNLLADIPGVEAVSWSSRNPFNSWGGNNSFEFEGEPMSFENFSVDSAFFRLFGVTYEPTGNSSVNGNMGMMLLNRPGYNALKVAEYDNEARVMGGVYPVAGILSDFNFRPLKEVQGMLMINVFGDDRIGHGYLAVKIAAGAGLAETSERVRRELASLVGTDRFEWEWADDTVREFYEAERRTGRVMAAFTVLVMLIMFMGIFAMSIYVLRQKEKQIAVRKVNGSTVGEILALLLRGSVVSVAVAFVVAAPVAWWASTRWLEGFPYKTAIAWWIFAAAGAAVLLLSLACVGWQSWRAATANPVKFLKGE